MHFNYCLIENFLYNISFLKAGVCPFNHYPGSKRINNYDPHEFTQKSFLAEYRTPSTLVVSFYTRWQQFVPFT